ncbi:hypothetical protein QYM36_002450, partial [Artemia franciscana]
KFKSKNNDRFVMEGNFKIQRVLKEIRDSEEAYLKQLTLLKTFFAEPSSDILDKKDHLLIFGHLDPIYETNAVLIHAMDTTIEGISKAFISTGPFLKLYSAYAQDYERIIARLEALKKTRKDFLCFLLRQESRPEVGCKLESLLITPIQRIPRYKLLLSELLSLCNEDDRGYFHGLKAALSNIEIVANHLNMSICRHDDIKRMVELQKRLQDNDPQIIAPGRKIVYEGKVLKISKTGCGKQERYIYLFNDVLMYTKKKQNNGLECCCLLPLKECTVEKYAGSIFKVQCKDETLIFLPEKPEDAVEWIKQIQNAIDQVQEKSRTLLKDDSFTEPLRNENLKSVRRAAEVVLRHSFHFSPTRTRNSAESPRPSSLMATSLSRLSFFSEGLSELPKESNTDPQRKEFSSPRIVSEEEKLKRPVSPVQLPKFFPVSCPGTSPLKFFSPKRKKKKEENATDTKSSFPTVCSSCKPIP